MRFSTSAVLATVAICAGQTFADCTIVDTPAGKTAKPCTNRDNTWTCHSGRDSAFVYRDNEGAINIGSLHQKYIFKIACPERWVDLSCDANTPRWSLDLGCPNEKIDVFHYV
ncbi:hypothetical protein E4U42_005516 [Claviceps africana]|uniref:Uncharacterized protein n=1 Tax=Claviceps africana TaxID=83212 RepID=A0A8K0NK03_9HYPO|nr:hypothetical protein E4U42_005516 [Claviceps africana]